MKNSQKGFVVPLLIVIVVLVIGGGVYYFSQQKRISRVQNTVDVTVSESVNQIQGISPISYKDDWGYSFSIPQGWSYISTTTPTSLPQFGSRSFRVIKMVPGSDKSTLLNSTLSKTVIKSDEFNSEVIYAVESRNIQISSDVLQKNLTDDILLKSAINNMYGSMDVRDTSGITVYDKGSLQRPLTGFYTYSKSGSNYELMVSLIAKDNSGNASSISIVYLGRNGNFSQETAKSIVDSLNIDSNKLKPYLDHQLSIKSGAIQLKVSDLSPTNNPQTDNDVIVKSRLSMARNGAELYYNNSNSYSGYCATDKNYKDIKDSVAPVNLGCKDNSAAYAISAPIKIGGYWCVDSTGYQGTTKSLNTTTACGK